jgi:predicted transcriptional regulator
MAVLDQQLKQRLEQDVQSRTLDWMAEEALADLAARSCSG